MTEQDIITKLKELGFEWHKRWSAVNYHVSHFTNHKDSPFIMKEQDDDFIVFSIMNPNTGEKSRYVPKQEAYAQLYKAYVTYKLGL
jgi:hypothetical protein